jgi:hypothetical protein
MPTPSFREGIAIKFLQHARDNVATTILVDPDMDVNGRDARLSHMPAPVTKGSGGRHFTPPAVMQFFAVYR